jgi:hypothetical protein
VLELRQDNKRLREEMASTSVKMGGRVFMSLSDTRDWVTLHGVTNVVHLFVDAMSFIQLATREIRDTKSGIDFEHRSKKSG